MADWWFSAQLLGAGIVADDLPLAPYVSNRLLIQVAAPDRAGSFVTTSFRFDRTNTNPVTRDVLYEHVPHGVLFKNVRFAQKFGEPLHLRLHVFHDIDAAVFGKGTARVTRIAPQGPISFGQAELPLLIGRDESVQFRDDFYALKLGSAELDLDPGSDGGHAMSVVLRATDTVRAWLPSSTADPRVRACSRCWAPGRRRRN